MTPSQQLARRMDRVNKQMARITGKCPGCRAKLDDDGLCPECEAEGERDFAADQAYEAAKDDELHDTAIDEAEHVFGEER